MRFRKLGRTELRLPEVSFGAWAIGGWYWGGSDDERSVAALHAALEAGSTAIDTAPVYGFGRSERVVGRALHGLRERATVMTKAGLRWDDPRGELFFETADAEGRRWRIHKNSRPDSLRHEVHASLERLGVETIDLLQIHWPDSTTPLADSLGALLELRAEGKLREIGVSNFSRAQLDEAERALGGVLLASTQERYSLLARGIEREVLPWAREHGAGVIAYSPLEQGLLTGAVSADREIRDDRSRKQSFSPAGRAAVNAALDHAVRPIAERHGATLAQIVLAWTAAQPGITTVLAGARSPEQARENAAAGDLNLTPPELDSIGRAFEGLDLRPRGLLARLSRRLLRR
jgi:aryl-alcohol dehydrogenase-like predicted oxidoreductase